MDDEKQEGLRPFLVQDLNYLSIDEAERLIQDGWIGQFRGTGYISQLIQGATGGVHSHSAMFARRGNGIDVLEMREFKGGRVKDLREYLLEETKEIDIFAVDVLRWPEFDLLRAVNHMRDIVEGPRVRQYSYVSILRIFLRKMPFLWRLLTTSTDDELSSGNSSGFCSHAVAEAHRVGGGVDPVPRLPDHWVDPNHLTRSLLYEYYGTVRA